MSSEETYSKEHVEIMQILARLEANTKALQDSYDRTEKDLSSISQTLILHNSRLTVLETLDFRSVKADLGSTIGSYEPRIQQIENRIHTLEYTHTNWSSYIGTAFNLAQSIAVAYLCYKLGFNP